MLDLSGDAYLWVKALHLISVISWMAGLLYLPRLFVYHTQVDRGSQASETFKVMERRLLRAIMHPAMAASVLFGVMMWAEFGEDALAWGWFLAKLVCVAGLVATHFFLARCVGIFAKDENQRPEKFYRVINEVPTLLMIAIVIFAVIKPF